MTFDEFQNFYEKNGYCPNDLIKKKRNNPLNPVQLKSRFKDYERGLSKKEEAKKRHNKTASKKVVEKDLEWEEVCRKVDERDHYSCQLLKALQYHELKTLQDNAKGFLKIIDHAHIVPRTESASLKYDPYNVICLNRYSHSMIDTYHDPITGEPLTKEEHKQWWIKIVGEARYNYLIKKK